MTFPPPFPGQVIRYSFLWHEEHLKGREEGIKDRPCAVVLVTRNEGGKEIVIVLPITHAPPDDAAATIELPHNLKITLGLDDQRSWIVLTEANRFVWPGPDLRPAVNGDATSIVYGQLPGRFFAQVLARFLEIYDSRRLGVVPRTE